MTPESLSDTVKRLWDTAIQHINTAVDTEDVDIANCYSSIAQSALMAAQFALTNPGVILGIPADAPLQPGVPPPSGMPAGAPPLPTWGGQK